jgi:hypothetical protein
MSELLCGGEARREGSLEKCQCPYGFTECPRTRRSPYFLPAAHLASLTIVREPYNKEPFDMILIHLNPTNEMTRRRYQRSGSDQTRWRCQVPKSYIDYPLFEKGSSEDRPDWHRRVYAGSDGTVGKRTTPSKTLRDAILAKQDNCCLYCGNRFGSLVKRRTELRFVLLAWDHAAPFVYLQRNPTDNWVAACRACNGIKYAQHFDSLIEAQDFIRQRRREKGYES